VSSSAELLRDGLLEGVAVLVVDAGEASSLGLAVRETCEQLGARVHVHAHETAVDDDAAMDRVIAAITPAPAVDGPPAPGSLDMLVVDGAALFAAGGLRACLDCAWDATRAVVNGALLPAGRGGRIVYLAPAPGADRSQIVQQANAARAGLENLARTLSVEWARHEITPVMIALGDTTAPGEVGALVAYLASPAGAYFSGCQLDLRGVAVAS
jgi:NAD(P)-dependent dehydrogenase (short-subunit alcohol dehydrogenase family)